MNLDLMIFIIRGHLLSLNYKPKEHRLGEQFETKSFSIIINKEKISFKSNERLSLVHLNNVKEFKLLDSKIFFFKLLDNKKLYYKIK